MNNEIGFGARKGKKEKNNRKELEEVEGVEREGSIRGTSISFKKIVVSRPEISLETLSPHCL